MDGTESTIMLYPLSKESPLQDFILLNLELDFSRINKERLMSTRLSLCQESLRQIIFQEGFKRCSISHQQNISLKNILQKFLFEPIQLHGQNIWIYCRNQKIKKVQITKWYSGTPAEPSRL